VNSTIKPNFKVIFAEFRTCGSHKQCMGSTVKTQTSTSTQMHCYLNPAKIDRIRVCLDIAYFVKTEKLLLKVL